MAYSTIIKPSDYFNTKLYTGTGSANAITGVGFQPDFVWQKSRSAGEGHGLFDAVRGVTNRIQSNTDGANSSQAGSLTAFGSDGFTVGGSPNNDAANGNGQTFVSWNWKANGQGSSNTDGSINSTYTSANTTSKCSIVTYTGTGSNATVGHGLGVVPESIWVKCTSNGGEDWMVYHKIIGGTHYLTLNNTGGDNSGGEVIWNDTIPDEDVFSIGTNGKVNGSGRTYVAYVFAGVKAYSKFSNYFGNGNADGTFVYTGFKPGWLMIKNAAQSGDQWQMNDDKRGFNGAINTLYADSAEVSTSADAIDLLSNGFKMRNTSGARNNSGVQYLYWAFASNPFVANSGESIPTTAR